MFIGSILDGLHQSLIAQFRPVRYDGSFVEGEPTVVAALLEGGTHSLQANWQSPFEAMGPESKAPAITAMLQSGALLPLTQQLSDAASSAAAGADRDSLTGALAGAAFDSFSAGSASANEATRSVRGKTGVTKLNSTQAFSGMPPCKLSISVHFRAFRDPRSEVELPVQRLFEWAVPQFLAPDSLFVGAVTDSNRQSGFLNNLLPSNAPMLINFRHGGRVFSRMVIESIEEPITAPRDRNGNRTECTLAMTLATLTALDREDIIRYFEGREQAAPA